MNWNGYFFVIITNTVWAQAHTTTIAVVVVVVNSGRVRELLQYCLVRSYTGNLFTISALLLPYMMLINWFRLRVASPSTPKTKHSKAEYDEYSYEMAHSNQVEQDENSIQKICSSNFRPFLLFFWHNCIDNIKDLWGTVEPNEQTRLEIHS